MKDLLDIDPTRSVYYLGFAYSSFLDFKFNLIYILSD